MKPVIIDNLEDMHRIDHDMGESACKRPAFFSAKLHQVFGVGRYYPSSKAGLIRLLDGSEPPTGVPILCGSCGAVYETAEVVADKTYINTVIPEMPPA